MPGKLVSVRISSIQSQWSVFPVISNPLEDPFYYLKNFQHVLDWIAARYDDVLSVDEQCFIAGFAQLPVASQALWVRMVMRKGVHFRASKLNYPEIGEPSRAATALLALGWLDEQAPLGLAEVFELLQNRRSSPVSAHISLGPRPGNRTGSRNWPAFFHSSRAWGNGIPGLAKHFIPSTTGRCAIACG